MKKSIISLSLALTVAVSSFANPGGPTINEKVKQSFSREFAGTQVLEWNNLGEFVQAIFLLGGHRAEAYFSPEGAFIGSSRSIFYNQLPLAVMTALDKRFENAGVDEVKEVITDEGTAYYVSFVVDGKTVKVKSDTAGNIEEVEKAKK